MASTEIALNIYNLIIIIVSPDRINNMHSLCMNHYISLMLYEHGVMVMPLSTKFPLYRGSQFLWWRKPEYPANTTDLPIMLYQVHLALVGFELINIVLDG
jgi:hypothetical protein